MRQIWPGLVTILASWILFGASGGSAASRAANALSKDEVLERLEFLETQGHVFSCQGMVDVVNGLRHLGKDEALKLLRQYYSIQSNEHSTHHSREMNIICVCRLLFVAPKGGWKEPWADVKEMQGLDSPGYKPAAKPQFPLYPMALSNGVPFLLIVDWMSPNGMHSPIPDEGRRHLDLCATLELVPSDLATSGYDDAAKKLVSSDEFNNLFPARSLSNTNVRDWILAQATNKIRGPSERPGATNIATNPAAGSRP